MLEQDRCHPAEAGGVVWEASGGIGRAKRETKVLRTCCLIKSRLWSRSVVPVRLMLLVHCVGRFFSTVPGLPMAVQCFVCWYLCSMIQKVCFNWSFRPSSMLSLAACSHAATPIRAVYDLELGRSPIYCFTAGIHYMYLSHITCILCIGNDSVCSSLQTFRAAVESWQHPA